MKKTILSMVTLAILGSCNNDSSLTEDNTLGAENKKEVATAGRKCKTDQVFEANLAKDPAARIRYEKSKAEIQNYLALLSSGKVLTDGSIEIPVAVNVLYTDASNSLTNADIANQITILNKAFAAQNSNYKTTPAEFLKVGSGDTKIKFKLVKTTRLQTIYGDWEYYEPSESFGIAASNPAKILNIYVAPGYTVQYTAVAGLSTMPSDYAQSYDGVYIDREYFGTRNNIGTLGITLVHEVGHYLGLDHIFGATGIDCDSDNIADTPTCQESFGDPIYPVKHKCGGVTRSVMFMNYMDGTSDNTACLFSAGQRNVMKSTLNTTRLTLKNSTSTGS
jgi:Pregnancy-associated plasma protein-A